MKVTYCTDLAPERIFMRNQMFLGAPADKIPNSIMVNGKQVSTEGQEYPMMRLPKTSVYEVLALYLLNNLSVGQSDSKTSMMLRDYILEYGQTNDKVYVAFQNSLYKAMENFDEFMQSFPINFKQSKVKVGIQGNTLYANFKDMKETPKDVFIGVLDLIFGRDTLGKLIGEIIADTGCPNLVDLVDGATLKTLLQTMQSKTPITSLKNYFTARGMVYLDQTVFLRLGLVCGYANTSLVNRYIKNLGLNAIQKQELNRDLAESGGRDIVVLAMPTVSPAYLNNKLLYFTAGKFQQFINKYHEQFGVCEKGSKIKWVLPLTPQFVTNCGGIVYKY